MRRQLGQTSTEYMMVIAVIVVALAFVVYTPMEQALMEGGNSFKQTYRDAGNEGYMGQASDGRR